jgi:hypothetical protein
MLEMGVRKVHRSIGIYLVAFLAVQTLTGLLISVETMAGSDRVGLWSTLVAAIHHDWNPLGSLFRINLAVFTVVQGLSGVIIFMLLRARTRKQSEK